jgi:hypothetical protein
VAGRAYHRSEMRKGLLVMSVVAATLFAVAAGAQDAVKPAPRPAHGAAPWLAPTDPLKRTRQAGLTPERHETLIHHVHAHLDVFVNGKAQVVPAGIGINIRDPGVKTFTNPDGSKAYGGIQLCNAPCISPLHTHDDSGILHTESATPVPNRLGQFFTEWGVALSRKCVGGYCKPDNLAIYVDGKLYTADPRAIQLSDKKEIAIVIGTPPAKIPSKFPTS